MKINRYNKIKPKRQGITKVPFLKDKITKTQKAKAKLEKHVFSWFVKKIPGEGT